MLQNEVAATSTKRSVWQQWALLAGPNGRAWIEEIGEIPEAHDFDLKCYRIGDNCLLRDVQNRWNASFGVTESGAVLIRPDGFIAWREPRVVGKLRSRLSEVLHALSFKDETLKEGLVA